MDLWQKLKRLARTESGTFSDAWLGLMHDRRQEKAAEDPVPFCCPFAAGFNCLRALQPFDLGDPDYTKSPQWHIFFEAANGRQLKMEPRHCPSCGAALPKFRKKKKPPRRAPNLKDAGRGSCSKCGERECFCSTPASLWEVDNAPKIVAATALLINDKQQILSVSRKTNPNDKGLPGGRIERGETPTEAMIRELREETGLIAQEYHLVFDAADDLKTRCVTFRVTKYKGKIRTKEKGVVAWVPALELLSKKASFQKYNLSLLARVDPYNTLLLSR